ncbi:MAG: ABC transporter permease [Halobacterium sp.]
MISPRTKRNLKKEFSNSFLAKVGVGLFGVIAFVAVFAPLLAPHNPTTQHLQQKLLPPIGMSAQRVTSTSKLVNGSVQVVTETTYVQATWKYPLGTNSLGQGVLSRVIYGARTSLTVGLLGVVVAAVIGVPVGLVAGFYGGKVDDVLMRGADVMLAFPSLVLAISLVGLFGTAAVKVPDPIVVLGLAPNMPPTFTIPGTVVLVVGLVNWVWLARIARGEALTISEEEYVKAARSIGASDTRVLTKHVLPNAVTPILVLATTQVAAIILLESSLSFLGFSGTTLSWGFNIQNGQNYLAGAWWIATFSGVGIVLSVMSVNFIGDWLRDALDPGVEGEGGV